MLSQPDKEFKVSTASYYYELFTTKYDTEFLQLDSLSLFADALGFDWDKSSIKRMPKGFYSKEHGFVSFNDMVALHSNVLCRVTKNSVETLSLNNKLKFEIKVWKQAHSVKLVHKVSLQVIRNKKKLEKNGGFPFKVQNNMVKFTDKVKGEE